MNWKDVPEMVESVQAHGTDEKKHLFIEWDGYIYPDGLVPPGGEIMGYMTAAGYLGTMDSHGEITEGLLGEDRIFIIFLDEKVSPMWYRFPELVEALKLGEVSRQLAVGLLQYEVRATIWFVVRKKAKLPSPLHFVPLVKIKRGRRR